MEFTEEQKRAKIIEKVIEGKSNFEISCEMFMSMSSIEKRLTVIYQDFGITGDKKRTPFIIQVLKMQSEGLL